MQRRRFTALVLSAVLVPLGASAQQQQKPVVGFLQIGTSEANANVQTAFRKGLSETGYFEGQNVTVEYHWAEGRFDRLPRMAADLVHRQVTVIAATSTPAALAAKATGTTIPIVFETAGDPIKLGLVASLSRPGDNITGVTQLSSELISKRLGLLHDLLPNAKLIGLLVDQSDPRVEAQTKDMQQAAEELGLQIHVLNASTESEVEKAFEDLSQVGASGLLVGTGEFLRRQAGQLVGLAARQKLPTIYQYSQLARAGGLVSYGTNLTDAYRQAGVYAGRILKGEKPGDLPVLQATKFELVINLKAAKALGLTIPPGVFAIADEVIE